MLIIFDCDGVILDNMHLHGEVEAEAYSEIGINISSKELTRRFSGVAQSEVSRILEEETGCKIPADLELLIDQRKEEVFTQRMKATKGIEDTLNALKETPRCVASGSALIPLRQSLGIVGLLDYFMPHVYSSEQVKRGKPFPDLFLHAAAQLGHKRTDCLVIEDGIAGVKAGCAAGMRVFGFTGGSHCDEGHGDRLKAEGAEIIFSEMKELPHLINQFWKG